MIKMGKIAIIAGEGVLPEIISRRLAEQQTSPYIFAIGGTREALRPFAQEIWPVFDLDLKGLLHRMLAYQIDTLILAGQVSKKLMYQRENLDQLLQQTLDAEDNNDHALLGRIVETIEKMGIHVVGYRDILFDLLTPRGQISQRGLTEDESKDIAYGCSILSQILPLSFGQSIVVHDGAVVAVEAMEGTDAMIQRAGDLVHGGSVIKMMRIDQDERFDIPVVGPHTLQVMAKAGQTSLALEVERTLLLEKEHFLDLAANLDIAVVGVDSCLSS